MTLTTIKVSTGTRDRLKAAARAQRSTLDELLQQLITEHERRERLQAMRAAMATTSPDLMRAYLDEAAEWERAEAAAHG
jgi:macrodomain Ter protein organizer (MatP/YcbG family)